MGSKATEERRSPLAADAAICCSASRSFKLSVRGSTPVVSCIEVPGTVAAGSSGRAVLEALGGLDTLCRVLHPGAQVENSSNPETTTATASRASDRRDDQAPTLPSPITVATYSPICDAAQDNRAPPCLYLRCAPRDIFSKFLKANRWSRNDLLVRLSKRNGRIVDIELVGLVVERFVFDGLCDFFCAPPASVPRSLHLDVEALLNEASQAPVFIPPPTYTRATSPQNYRLDDLFDYAAAAAAAAVSGDGAGSTITAPLNRLRRHRRRLDLRLRLAQAAHSTVSSETLRTAHEQQAKAGGASATKAPVPIIRRRRRRRDGLVLLPGVPAEAEPFSQPAVGASGAASHDTEVGSGGNQHSVLVPGVVTQPTAPCADEGLPSSKHAKADPKRPRLAITDPSCSDQSATPEGRLTESAEPEQERDGSRSWGNQSGSPNPRVTQSDRELDSSAITIDAWSSTGGPGNWQSSEAFNAVARFNDPTIPSEPPAAALSVIPEPELLDAYHRLFFQRPIWLRPMLDLRVSLSASSWKKKPSLAHTCYCISDGPWRGALCRLGYDPRKDPAARIYQTIDFRDRYFRAISWRLPTKTSKSFLHTSYLRMVPPGLKSINGGTSISPNAGHCESYESSTAMESAVAPRGAQEELPLATSELPSSSLEDELFFRIPPSRPSQLFQLCDIDEPGVQHLLQVNSPSAACTKKDGWFPPGFLSQVRDLMEMTVKKMRDSGFGSQRGLSINGPPGSQDSQL